MNQFLSAFGANGVDDKQALSGSIFGLQKRENIFLALCGRSFQLIENVSSLFIFSAECSCSADISLLFQEDEERNRFSMSCFFPGELRLLSGARPGLSGRRGNEYRQKQGW